MAENYYSYLDALEAPSAAPALPKATPLPDSSDEAFFADIARQTLEAHQTQPPVEEPGWGSKALGVVGDIVGAQKHGIDWLARQAASGLGVETRPGETTGQMLRRGVGLESTPEQGYGGAILGRGLEFATDIATDPLTYETAALGKLVGAGVKGAQLLRNAEATSALTGSLGALAPEAISAAEKAASLGSRLSPLHTAVGAGFTGMMGLGAFQEGAQAAHTIGEEGFTPRAAEEVLGTGLSGLGALAGGAHLASSRPVKPVDPALTRGLQRLVAKGELAPEEAAVTVAREQGMEAPPTHPGLPPELHNRIQDTTATRDVVLEPQPTPQAAPPPTETPRGVPSEAAVEAPVASPLNAEEGPRGKVAAPPEAIAPEATETLLPVEPLSAESAPPPLPNPTATVPVEPLEAWASRVEPLQALGYTPSDIVGFSKEPNGLAHVDDIIGRGRPKGQMAPQTRFGGKALEGPPPTPPEALEDALRASLKPEEIQEASRQPPLPPGALEGKEALSEAIVGRGTRIGPPVKDEYSQILKERGKAGAREWLEERFIALTQPPSAVGGVEGAAPEPGFLAKVKKASDRALIEGIEDKRGKGAPSLYEPGSPAAKVAQQYPHRLDFIQEKVAKLLAQDTPSAREIMALPAEERPQAIENFLRGATRKAEISAHRRAAGVLSLEAAGQQAAEATSSAFSGGKAAPLTGMPKEWTNRLREFKKANDSFEKAEGRLTEKGKAQVSSRVEDLTQRLIAGYYEHPSEAVSDLAELSNLASTYSKDFTGLKGARTPWATLQEQLQRRVGMESQPVEKGFENFAQKLAGRLGLSIEDWVKARFTQDPSFMKAMGEKRAAGELQGAERAPRRGEGLVGLLGQVEATPVEGHPDLQILNHTEARTPALDAATHSFAQEAAEPLRALYERLRSLTGAQGGTLGGFTSSTAHEGAFVGGKSFLNPSYHFKDAIDTARLYGLEGDAEAIKSIAATRAVATLEHEFLHDLGGHKTEAEFAEALKALQTASRADPQYAKLEQALRESISDGTVEQFRETTPTFERLVKERYGDTGIGSREGALQGAREGGTAPIRGAEPGGGERLPESGEGLGDRTRGGVERGAGRVGGEPAFELAAASRHAPEEHGASQRGGGAEAARAGEEAGPNPTKARGESPEEIRRIAALASGNFEEIKAATHDLLHARLRDAAEALPDDSKEALRRKTLLRYAVGTIPKGEFDQRAFVKAMRNAGAPKDAAKGLWEAFKGAAEGGSVAEFQDLFGKVIQPGGWKNWRTWANIWKANFLGPASQVGNIVGNTALQGYRQFEQALAAPVLDMIGSKVTGEARSRYVSEFGAAMRGRAFANKEAFPDLIAAIKQAASLKGEDLTQVEKHLGSYEDVAKAALNAPTDSKLYEFLTIPYKALSMADDFAKHKLKWEEFYREGHRSGKALGLKGDALHAHEATMAQEMNQGLLEGKGPLFEKHQRSIDRAAEYRMKRDTLQTALGGDKAGWLSKAAAAINEKKSDLPPLDILFPFPKTATNATLEALIRTPYGFRMVYKAFKRGDFKADPSRFYDELAKPMLGTAVMGGIMTQMLGTDFITGQGPEDPKQQALKRETGWQPYSFHIGDKYIPFNRIEPLASVLGMAADMKEAIHSGKKTTAQVKLKLALSSIGKNLLNKTFLAQLSGAMQAGADPVRFGPQFIKQLTGSIAPNVLGVVPVGGLAAAIDPVMRKTTIATAPLAKIPFASKLLPEQETALGTPRERTGGEGILAGLQRLLLPSQVTSVRSDVGARVAGELDRLDFPMQPPRSYIEIQGKRIDLSQEQQRRLREAQFQAVNHMNRMIQDRTYQSLPDTPDDALPGQKTKEYLLKRLLERYKEPIMNEIRARAKVRAFQSASQAQA